MLRSEKITDGPIGTGTRFRATTRSGRRVVEMLIEVAAHQRPTRFGSHTTMSKIDIDGGMSFEAVPEGAKMRWAWVLLPKGRLRVLGPVFSLLGRRQEGRIWTGLKAQLAGSWSR